ncbi:MAG: 4-(cytidine 5'-diphospho)-2-C-methyl-D-erythritol kinase, partial [Chloroflexi bacterium]
MLSSLTVAAPAKINLFLHITGKRDDGYHTLITRMQKLDLCDSLSLQLTNSGAVEFSCSDNALAGRDNLAVRAAGIFLAQSRTLAGMGLRIELVKNIPVAAGLGGGSSDAGTTLQALNQLAGEEYSAAELVRMAISLGADVPFFAIAADAVLATGVGEIMQPVDSLDNFDFLLVNPGFSVSTAEIFQNFILTSSAKKSKLARLQQRSFSLETMSNDLEEVTI